MKEKKVTVLTLFVVYDDLGTAAAAAVVADFLKFVFAIDSSYYPCKVTSPPILGQVAA